MGRFEGRLSVVGRPDLMAVELQQGREHFGRVDIVVDDQDAVLRVGDPLGVGADDLGSGGLLFMDRQPHDKFGPGPRPVAAGLDPSAVHLHQAPHEGQPDAQAAFRAVERRLGLSKQVEEVRQELWIDADSRVANLDRHLLPAGLGDQPDDAAALGVFGGIVEEVGNDLVQADGVGIKLDRSFRYADDELMPVGVDQRAGRFDRAGDDIAQEEPLRPKLDFAPHEPRQVEQVVDEADHVIDLPLEHGDRFSRDFRVDPRGPHDFECIADRGQGITQFVGQRGEEFVLAAIGLLGLFVQADIFERDRGPLGKVLGHREVGRRRTSGSSRKGRR